MSRAAAGDAGSSSLRVGLTGNIGSGKSTVAALLAERGAAVIDADELARMATRDPEVLRRIERELGHEFVHGERLDRAALAARVFRDHEARRRLEGIVHPWVRAAAAARERDLRATVRPPVVVHDVPLLFESGRDAEMDATVVVTAPLETRVERAARRGGMGEQAVRERDAAQLPLAQKAARATFVLDNSGSEEDLAEQVGTLWRELIELRSARRPS